MLERMAEEGREDKQKNEYFIMFSYKLIYVRETGDGAVLKGEPVVVTGWRRAKASNFQGWGTGLMGSQELRFAGAESVSRALLAGDWRGRLSAPAGRTGAASSEVSTT
jgi:hypothetical protein